MELIADILLVAGALGAGLYCFVLSRRLKRFTDLEKGVGGAVSVLSTQAEKLRNSLDSARQASDDSGVALQALTERAETVAQRLELMMASMHDVVHDDPSEPERPEDHPLDRSDEGKAEEVSDAPRDPPEPAIETPKEESDPPAEAAEDTPEPAVKKPEGLMFFRHAATSGGAAQ